MEKVEAKLKVRLLEYTPEPEKVIAMAAKLCYSPVGVDDLQESLTQGGTEKFLKMLVSIGHESPIEHVSFTFAIEGVSRSLTHQLVRHRIGSFSQKSQRYVREGQFQYIIPPQIEAIPEAKEKFIQAMNNDQKVYDELVEILWRKHEQNFIAQGKSPEQAKSMAEKTAIEDARYVLPNACETKIMATFNARSLYNIFQHRCCNRAQWEIRELATQMLKLVKGIAPTLFGQAGPSCLAGSCPEGPMSCGQAQKVKEKFNSL